MEMHQVTYDIKLTGSYFFDMAMVDTAKKLCGEFPGLTCEEVDFAVQIRGELDDEAYQRFKRMMSGQ